MSQRLRDAFAFGKSEGRTLFLPYITAGYPRRQDTVPLLLALETAGGDVIELGVPFTDPLADGATVQHANQVAVEQDVTLEECLRMVAEARGQGLKAPILLMGYYNPIASLGEERCCDLSAAAGVDGFIVVDLPPEEAERLLAACKTRDLSMVPLVAPTTSDARIAILAGVADAFLYCVSVTGTTGARQALPPELPAFLERIRKVSTLPLAVGFGVSTRQHVVDVGKVAEGAVVGSAIIAAIDAGQPDGCVERVRRFVEDVTGRGPEQAR